MLKVLGIDVIWLLLKISISNVVILPIESGNDMSWFPKTESDVSWLRFQRLLGKEVRSFKATLRYVRAWRLVIDAGSSVIWFPANDRYSRLVSASIQLGIDVIWFQFIISILRLVTPVSILAGNSVIWL